MNVLSGKSFVTSSWTSFAAIFPFHIFFVRRVEFHLLTGCVLELCWKAAVALGGGVLVTEC